ncbi:hypothetical protein EBBID32_43600 [Sphingobium indicum BiD32]|uniref:Uncharacterized protein n=1 Tax=Sphingobium indicum BiD32 TaxID=1301087 RepID=N1MTA0_9SPHN|nr:hypothetical protein EBBID32_43600 [Sphingobium indicum BiD32]
MRLGDETIIPLARCCQNAQRSAPITDDERVDTQGFGPDGSATVLDG